MKTTHLLLWLALITILSACNQITTNQLVDLKTENRTAPLGIDRKQPRFSWIIKSMENGMIQSAYQVLVATAPSLLRDDTSDLWDSKKIISGQSNLVSYEGASLTSGSEVFWKVRIWDAQDRRTPWSDVASFSVGLLEKEDWKASWIGIDRQVGIDRPDIENRVLSARYLRKEFLVEKPVQTGHGLYRGDGHL